ncbi:hypothetical protein F4782DRAFT_530607 [Xylaria castorea]|nr:hypothetical protein F4782DRAFT_530607 [Xylaria castorea]
MSVLPDYKPLIAYDTRNRAVCFDHRYRVCGACCVDYRGTGRRSDVNNDEHVLILGTGMNRFMPPWDDQLLGPANTYQIETNYADHPKTLTPDQLSMYYCDECQLTWMKGNAGVEAVQSHPSHHTYQHIHSGTRRSLIVFTDGVCPSNGMSSAVNASIGVHFGPQSEYNISGRVNSDSISTNQAAEIVAAIEALRQVLQNIEPARRVMIRGLSPQAGENELRNVKRFRLIVVTDSSYVVECMSKHIENWSMENGIYRNEQDVAVHNSDGFAKLTHEVQELSMVGVQVVWYHVPREFNKEAGALAQLALRS